MQLRGYFWTSYLLVLSHRAVLLAATQHPDAVLNELRHAHGSTSKRHDHAEREQALLAADKAQHLSPLGDLWANAEDGDLQSERIESSSIDSETHEGTQGTETEAAKPHHKLQASLLLWGSCSI